MLLGFCSFLASQRLRMIVSLLLLVLGYSSSSSSEHYTVFDDATWPIRSTEMPRDRFPNQAAEYDRFMQGCREAAGAEADHRCGENEKFRLKMNTFQPSSMRNYTKLGYAKIRAPEAMYKLLKDFWDANKDQGVNEWGKVINPYHNMWESPPTVILVYNTSLVGGGNELSHQLLEYAREIMQEWTGQRLAPCSVHGIRIYHNNSILAPHTDRNPLITSAIVNVMQDVDEPWPLEVFGHDGIGRNITMEPGDMVLYESHSVVHGRPFRFQGRYFANIFFHFEVLENLDGTPTHRDGDLPPWVIGGSAWETEWRQMYPNGWQLNLFHDPHEVARRGDIHLLQNLALVSPEKLHVADANGWRPLHEAVRVGSMDAVKFLLEHGANVHQRTHIEVQAGDPGEDGYDNAWDGYSPLDIAYEYLGEDHEMVQFLKSLGGDGVVGPEL